MDNNTIDALEGEGPHAILIPLPLQGHVIPSVNLATKLASNGFTITFVNTHYIHHQICRSSSSSSSCSNSSSSSNNNNIIIDIFSGARDSRDAGDIRYRTISDGFPIGFDRSLNHDQFMEGLVHVFPAHVDEFVSEFVRSDQGRNVRLLIADTYYGWPAAIADKYGLLFATFWTEAALVLDLYYHLDLLRSHGHFGAKAEECRSDAIDYVPGVRPIKPQDLMSYIQPSCPDINSVCHRNINQALPNAKRAHFSIINTVRNLEAETISALQEIQPTYPVGPIFSVNFNDCPVSTSLWAESECSDFLDSKPDRSVLYVSFGSYAHATKETIHALARGLQLTGVSFLWVVRPDIVSSDDPNPLPEGFEEEVVGTGTGMVVKWCAQNKVLSHRAVGAFLTHCGWNSVLESLWCGVPMICYPLYTDQFPNRKLVVDDWEVGINLCDNIDVVVFTAQEVAAKINSVIPIANNNKLVYNKLVTPDHHHHHRLRVNAQKIKNTLRDAVGHGGSSTTTFNKLLHDIKLKAKHI